MIKRTLVAVLGLALLGAACGDSSDDDTAATSSALTTTAEVAGGSDTTGTGSEDTDGSGSEDTDGSGDGTGDSDATGVARRAFVSVMTDAGLDETDAECLADELLARGAGDLEALAGLQDDPTAALEAVQACDVALSDLEALAQSFLPEGVDGTGDSSSGDGSGGDGSGGDGSTGDAGTLDVDESAFVDAFIASLSQLPDIDESEARCTALALLEEGGGVEGAGQLAADLAALEELLEGCGVSLAELGG